MNNEGDFVFKMVNFGYVEFLSFSLRLGVFVRSKFILKRQMKLNIRDIDKII